MTLALFYAHAASNWGDLAINKGIVNLFKRAELDLQEVYAVRLPHNMIHTLNSDQSLDYLKVIPVNRPAPTDNGSLSQAFEYLSEIETFISDFQLNEASLVMLNSGEHLFEAADASNLGDLAWRLLPLIASAHAKKPVVQLPATLGPFYTDRVTRLVRYFLTNLDGGAVRENMSEALSRSYGRSLVPSLDPGFFGVTRFPSQSAPSDRGAVALIPRLEDFGLRSGTQRSAYVLAKNRDERYEHSKAFQLYLRIAEGILADTSDSVHLIIQTWADRELVQNLYAALSSSSYAARVWLHDPTDYETFTESLAGMDIVVTSRFHAAILSLTQAVPAIGIYSDSHGHKMPGLFGMLGMQRNAIRLQDRLVDEVSSEVLSAIDFSREKRQEIYESVVAWRKTSEVWFRDTVIRPYLSGKSSSSATLREIDQMRIDLLHELHGKIVGQERRGDYQTILARLKNIEDRIPSE